MAEGGQPQQQPPQLGPGAAARGMKRESELELPVPGAGPDGPEPGVSKRPRTEEAADGGMQVTARDRRPVTAGRGGLGPWGAGWAWLESGLGARCRGCVPNGAPETARESGFSFWSWEIDQDMDAVCVLSPSPVPREVGASWICLSRELLGRVESGGS